MDRSHLSCRTDRRVSFAVALTLGCTALSVLPGCLATARSPLTDHSGAWQVRVARLGAAPIQDPNDAPAEASSELTQPTGRPMRSVAARNRCWHLDLGFRVSHTKLGSTEQQLDRRLDIPLQADVLGVFRHPTTPIDRKSNLGLNSGFIGVGRAENEKLTWTWYFAGGAGEDRSDQRWLHLRLKVNFKYGSYLTGVTTEYYPWGRPVYSDLQDWSHRFRKSRPYIYGGVEGGYVSGQGKGEYTAFGRTLYKDGVTVRDWVVGFPIGLGWRIPLAEQWSLAFAGGYTFHLYRPEEYNGWSFATGLRYRF